MNGLIEKLEQWLANYWPAVVVVLGVIWLLLLLQGCEVALRIESTPIP